ncbi:hypothetical protein L798_02694 [Zootermopsis nevadensis]|uniref:Uncharacterized protein n=1 Tax=Zootermopsis nevadensis TaxID=136037 RepID=A0A067RDB6_ZOONE|nr:hypothetical protein L798_02694 [Zootermopsis nevadensis]
MQNHLTDKEAKMYSPDAAAGVSQTVKFAVSCTCDRVSLRPTTYQQIVAVVPAVHERPRLYRHLWWMRWPRGGEAQSNPAQLTSALAHTWRELDEVSRALIGPHLRWADELSAEVRDLLHRKCSKTCHKLQPTTNSGCTIGLRALHPDPLPNSSNTMWWPRSWKRPKPRPIHEHIQRAGSRFNQQSGPLQPRRPTSVQSSRRATVSGMPTRATLMALHRNSGN